MESDDLDDGVLSLVLGVEERLQRNPREALEFAEQAAPESAAHPEARLARARALVAARGAAAGQRVLEILVNQEPEFAEARHELALVYEELGDRASAARELLAVRRLDADEDRTEGFDLSQIEGRIASCAERVLSELPEKFRDRLSSIPVLIEDRPSEALVREGFDPRSLGLFEGAEHAEREFGAIVPAPTRIVLYAANLAAYVDPDDEQELAREVEITLLHEIGHYFGLGEAELEALGLG